MAGIYSPQGRAVSGRRTFNPVGISRRPNYYPPKPEPIPEPIPEELAPEPIPDPVQATIAPRPAASPQGMFDPTTSMLPGQTNVNSSTPFIGPFYDAGQTAKLANLSSIEGLKNIGKTGFNVTKGIFNFTPPGALLNVGTAIAGGPIKQGYDKFLAPTVNQGIDKVKGLFAQESAFPANPISGAQAASMDLADIDIGEGDSGGRGGRGGSGWGDVYGGEGGGYGF